MESLFSFSILRTKTGVARTEVCGNGRLLLCLWVACLRSCSLQQRKNDVRKVPIARPDLQLKYAALLRTELSRAARVALGDGGFGHEVLLGEELSGDVEHCDALYRSGALRDGAVAEEPAQTLDGFLDVLELEAEGGA
ncbi:sec7 domain containing protein, putative [Babesia ovata]|uniref:Sec7 domain containing protein, putative n=1 Tax=Babesia ovata TaxID=189622 RepID=A0A2H6KF74_9APIC|nr:sec7 domain containing protein, putative [Babesia ovata]GBE61650.1 sec7 domain containing protein, putative [Babesia ovata]